MADDAENDAAETVPRDEAPKGRTFTQDEIDAMIADRLAKADRKHEKELKDLESRYQSEIKKSKMDEAERSRAEAQEAIDSATKRAEEAEGRLKLREAEAALMRAGLPTELAPTVVGSTDEETEETVKALDKAVQERAAALYADRVAKGAPREPSEVSAAQSDTLARMRQAAGLK